MSKPLPAVEEPDLPALSKPGAFKAKISAAISPLVNFNRDREDITDPVALIRLGREVVPIDWMIREKKLGLKHFVAHGGTIMDFLAAGYTIDRDLIKFKDLDPQRSTPEHCLQTLVGDLQTRATHLLDYRNALPMTFLRKEYGLDPTYIAHNMGLVMHPELGPVAHDNTILSAGDLVFLGFSFEDIGLQNVQQWLSMQPTEEHAAALGATAEKIAALVTPAQPAPSVVMQHAVAPVPLSDPRVIDMHVQTHRRKDYGLKPHVRAALRK
jgi:hypothetical protein